MEVATLEPFTAVKLTLDLTDAQFFHLCQNNRDLRFERTATGELIIMPPTGSDTGNRNGRLIQQLFNWTDPNDLGASRSWGRGQNWKKSSHPKTSRRSD
ncbi:Uma2 family endonuclease, partial [Laspinema olomoucense]|uniref:Uma2 family endonuclease n=1 Tax=Laspinema olomoucense TaxID=3231600 RepID=UPI0021BA76FD